MKAEEETLDDTNLMSHSYDGIQEYDNPTPGWWKAIFVGTVIFSVAYFIWFHAGGPGLSETEQYERARAAYDEEYASEAATMNEEALATLADDPQALAEGKEVYQTNCVSCHGAEGKGQVGPNLTDAYQIHGSTRMDIYETVRDGVPAKGMIAWGPALPPDQLAAVSAYVATLRNADTTGGKEPEGEQVEPFSD